MAWLDLESEIAEEFAETEWSVPPQQRAFEFAAQQNLVFDATLRHEKVKEAQRKWERDNLGRARIEAERERLGVQLPLALDDSHRETIRRLRKPWPFIAAVFGISEAEVAAIKPAVASTRRSPMAERARSRRARAKQRRRA
jgi:hypothetical protein